MRAERCETCKFWEQDSEREGSCNRYPPMPVFDDNSGEVETCFTWTGLGHWCGEWKAADTEVR